MTSHDSWHQLLCDTLHLFKHLKLELLKLLKNQVGKAPQPKRKKNLISLIQTRINNMKLIIMKIQLAHAVTTITPFGIVENFILEVGMFVFLFDFVIVKMEDENNREKGKKEVFYIYERIHGDNMKKPCKSKNPYDNIEEWEETTQTSAMERAS